MLVRRPGANLLSGVVAAGVVVTRDVQAFTVAGGVPTEVMAMLDPDRREVRRAGPVPAER